MAGALRGGSRRCGGAVAPFPRPRVLYVLWPDPLIVPGRGALDLTELIDVAGGDSITADDGEAYPRFSLEAAWPARPRSSCSRATTPRGAALVRLPKWERLPSVPAIRAGRLHSADWQPMHRYGPRVVDGLEMLARIIHPEAFR